MAQAVQSVRPEARTTRRGLALNLHEGWIAGLLLAFLLISVTASVASANWVDGLWQAMWAALGAMLFGGLVARLRLNGLLALLLAGIVGMAFVSWLASYHVGAPPGALWNDKLVLIEERIDVWLARVLSGGIGTDNFIFLCVMLALGWLMGYLAAWSVFRHHQPWGAILPAGAALLINLFYAPPQSGIYLLLFLLAALLLLVRTTLLKRQQAWAAYAVRFANDIGLDFLVYGVVFSGLIILLAWVIPPTAPGPAWFGFILDRVRQPWQQVQDDVTRAFSAVRGTNNAAPTTYFGSSLAMGGPIRLGNREVFQIDAAYGRYWRAAVFDQYTGAGWVSSASEAADFIAADPRLKSMPMDQRRIVTETVQVRLPTDNLVVTASQPVQVSEPVNAKFFVGRTADNQPYLDVASLRLQKPVTLGDRYIVLSSVSAADEESLRKASTQVPRSISQLYLSVPASVPQRVRDLAFRITANARTNYDKAQAIEAYLREHITYNDAVDPVPAGRDGVDYVLFERPEGYCNYYASAMAVLARIVGIPARVASGYAVSDPSDDGLYHINEGNAHSWPELYLGELGWIEFEPTSARAPITRPVALPQTDPKNKLLELNQPDDPRQRGLGEKRLEELDQQQKQQAAAVRFWSALLLNPTAVSAYVFAGVGLLVVGVLLLVQWRWSRQVGLLKPGALAVQEMYRYARFAGLKDPTGATPDERAAELAALMPGAQAPIKNVTAAYVRERYGAHDLDAAEAATARATGIAVQQAMWGTIYRRYIGQRIEELSSLLNAQKAKFKIRISKDE